MRSLGFTSRKIVWKRNGKLSKIWRFAISNNKFCHYRSSKIERTSQISLATYNAKGEMREI